MSTSRDAQQLELIQKIRRGVVFVGLGLLLYTFFKPDLTIMYVRAAVWVAAGLLSILEGMKLTKVGAKAGNAWINALIYLAVAVVPILRAR